MCEYKVPAKSVTACAIYGCDLYMFSGNNKLDGVTAGVPGQISSNPHDGKVYIHRNAVPCGGYCDVSIQQ